VYYKFLSHLIVNVTVLLYYCCIVLLYRYYVLDLFHILWCQPVLDLWNVNKFNSIQFICIRCIISQSVKAICSLVGLTLSSMSACIQTDV
jgi:hypothetical protein